MKTIERESNAEDEFGFFGMESAPVAMGNSSTLITLV